ncbi:MAG: hypothetical protein P1V36_07475 [Planctomycetota bacterium]|nr:hypothetical protein [Planctomycetota bacterium]
MRTLLPVAALAGLFVVLMACGGGGGAAAVTPAGNPQALSFVNWEIPPVHPLALDVPGERLLLAHVADHRLEVFDVSAEVPAPLASIPVGLCPVSVRLRTPNEAWVVNHLSDTISIVDLAAARVVATLSTKDEPCDVVFAGTPERAYVSCSQVDIVQVFDPANLASAPLDIAIAGEDPRALAVSPDGSTVYAAVFESGNATTLLGGGIDEAGAINTTGFFPPNIVNDPATPHLGVNPPPNSGVQTTPAPNLNLPPPPKVGLIVRKDAAGVWSDDNGGDWTSYISGLDAPLSGRPIGWDLPDRDVAIIDTATAGVTYARSLMNLCMDVSVNPASGAICVIGTDATNEVRYEPNVNGTFVRVLLAIVDASAPTTRTIQDLNPHLTYTQPRVPQVQRDRSLGDPRVMVWNGAGTRAYVAGLGSNNVIRLTAAGAREGTPIEVGEGPCGLALHEAAGRLYVWNRFGGSISTIATASHTETARTPIFDPTPAVIRAGRPALYDTHETSGLGHVSCASCHIDARIDRLAWDLGDPSGEMKSIPEQNCGLGNGLAGLLPCPDFHPQKGPMTTQTLQDIVGHEPHHWRGDRRGLEEFAGAFEGLLGDDAPPPPPAMQAFEDFLATIAFPPNPFRGLDNTLPTDLPLPGHYRTGRFGNAGDPLPNGNAVRGLQLYRTAGLDGSLAQVQLDCVTCHTLPTGLGPDRALNINPFNLGASTYTDELPAGPAGERHLALVSVDGSTNIAMKVPQLRNMHEKTGFECTQVENTAGFGFLHDGSVDSLARFVSEPLFGVGDDQEVADLVAFMLAFAGSDLPQGTTQGLNEPPGPPSLDTHAAVGQQTHYTGGSSLRLGAFLALAGTGAVDVIVKGVQAGENRGWMFDRSTGRFLSDRDSEAPLTPAALQAFAGAAAPQVWTVVPVGTGTRLGIDRDEDGFGDATERDAGSSPTSQLSTP